MFQLFFSYLIGLIYLVVINFINGEFVTYLFAYNEVSNMIYNENLSV